jgi:hypothetical protein
VLGARRRNEVDELLLQRFFLSGARATDTKLGGDVAAPASTGA